MRIISGESRGRRLVKPKGHAIRPTSDRVKESIFNILGDEVRGKTILDLYAGTGNLGIEALSRGARKVVFVERERQALRIIEKNLSQCGVKEASEILATEVHRAIGVLSRRGDRFDIILMDPPYRQAMIQPTLTQLSTHRIYREDTLLVVEHDRREPLPDPMEGWSLIRHRPFGDTIVSILNPHIAPPVPASNERQT